MYLSCFLVNILNSYRFDWGAGSPTSPKAKKLIESENVVYVHSVHGDRFEVHRSDPVQPVALSIFTSGGIPTPV